jgi:hypothetical protein
MRVSEARATARRWVLEEAHSLPGFGGAFLHGSINWMADDELLAPTSDVDLLVLHDDPPPTARRGKFRYHGLLLEASYLPNATLATAEQILGAYHLAGSFRMTTILADPSGRLASLHAAVAEHYARREWVRARCDDAANKVRRFLTGLDEPAQQHDHATTVLFAAGVTTHVLLVAGLRNPTVRRRYVTVRELLAEHDLLHVHEQLLDLLGCAAITPARVSEHLAALAKLFDATASVVATPFPFAADIAPGARSVAIDGSRELIERGLHREAMFWIAATALRCQKVLAHDGTPEQRAAFLPPTQALLADLGIASEAERSERAARIAAYLPQLSATAETIMAATPGIE